MFCVELASTSRSAYGKAATVSYSPVTAVLFVVFGSFEGEIAKAAAAALWSLS